MGTPNARGPGTFAFMVSRQAADSLRGRLRNGESIVLNAHVKATVGPGHWTVVTGTIPGSDAAAGEVVYSCHLDHERPGANDNGSGCVTILESARALARLIASGALPRPQRTLRFIWGPEVEGTMAFLATHPDIRKSLRANIHMDMVGGDPFKNKSVFHGNGHPVVPAQFLSRPCRARIPERNPAAAASEFAASGGPPDPGIIETRVGEQGTRNELIADITPYSAAAITDDFDSSTIRSSLSLS